MLTEPSRYSRLPFTGSVIDDEGIPSARELRRTLTVHWSTADIPDQKDRVAVVTGSNSGLGYQVALALAVADATVVLACRNIGKAESAVASITASVPSANVKSLQLDLADLATVEVSAANFRGEHHHLDLLVNNAGLMAVDKSRTVDGFETQLAVNHLGHFAPMAPLLPAMLTTPGAGIASISSWRSGAGTSSSTICSSSGADTALGRSTTRASSPTCSSSWSCSDVSLRRVQELSL